MTIINFTGQAGINENVNKYVKNQILNPYNSHIFFYFSILNK